MTQKPLPQQPRTQEAPAQKYKPTNLSAIQPLLDELHALAEATDPHVVSLALETAVERKATTSAEVSDILVDAYIPVDAANGALLHLLAAARRPGRVVEFGTSMGISAIYLAAALGRDEAPVVTTEIESAKVARASANLASAGLRDQVHILEGDAFETLADFGEPISLLFLDGWKEMYLPMLTLLEPLLVPGAFVVADDTILFAKQCEPLVSYLHHPESGYAAASLPHGDGMEIATRVAA